MSTIAAAPPKEMTPWAASYFSSFTAEEVNGLYACLHTLPPAVSK